MIKPHTPPHCRPVPAVPIVVVSTTKGACRVHTVGGMFVGPALCQVIAAAYQMDMAALNWKG